MSNIGQPITARAADIHGDPSKQCHWYLCHPDGTPVLIGAQAKSFRGDYHCIVGGRPPHKEGSTGRVYTHSGGEFYPSVFDLVWYDETTMSEQTEGEYYGELERGYAQDRI